MQGRQIGADKLARIQELISSHPDWRRTRISQELCREWNWCNKAGRLKGIAARSLLRKLDRHGLIQLPAPVRSANNAFRNRPDKQNTVEFEPLRIESRLTDLQPLRILLATQTSEVQLFRTLLQQYHHLGYSGPVGENLKYLVYDRQDRLLGCLLYGAAAWRVASRDRFIGWDESARKCGLSRIANNMRFLILPGIRVPHLANHLLAIISRRISGDWQNRRPRYACCSAALNSNRQSSGDYSHTSNNSNSPVNNNKRPCSERSAAASVQKMGDDVVMRSTL